MTQNVLRIRDSKHSSIIDQLATLLCTVWNTIEALRAMLPAVRMTTAFVTLCEAALMAYLRWDWVVYNRVLVSVRLMCSFGFCLVLMIPRLFNRSKRLLMSLHVCMISSVLKFSEIVLMLPLHVRGALEGSVLIRFSFAVECRLDIEEIRVRFKCRIQLLHLSDLRLPRLVKLLLRG